MTEKEKVPSGAATPKRTTEAEISGISTESCNNSTTNKPNGKSYMTELLFRCGAVGEKNGISAKDLASISGLGTTRQVRLAVADARATGVVCASSHGYFLPDMNGLGVYTDVGIAEIRRFCHRALSMGNAMINSARSAKRVLDIHDKKISDDQISIFDLEETIIWQPRDRDS